MSGLVSEVACFHRRVLKKNSPIVTASGGHKLFDHTVHTIKFGKGQRT